MRVGGASDLPCIACSHSVRVFKYRKGDFMRVQIVLLIVLALAACATTENGTDKSPEAPEAWEVPLTDEEAAHIATVETDGRYLYRSDQYAAEATDILLDAVDLADYPNFVGWIGYEGKHVFTVSFYEKTEDEVSLVADVHFYDFGASSLDLNPERIISERELSMLNARMAALEVGTSSCSNRFNTVVMPATEDDDAWLVYVLAATTNPDAIVVGGHSRVRVDKESAEVLGVESLSNSCLTIDKSLAKKSGSETAAVVVTHRVTPMPVPVHPFLSLLHEQPVIVISERGRWVVAGHNIRLFVR